MLPVMLPVCYLLCYLCVTCCVTCCLGSPGRHRAAQTRPQPKQTCKQGVGSVVSCTCELQGHELHHDGSCRRALCCFWLLLAAPGGSWLLLATPVVDELENHTHTHRKTKQSTQHNGEDRRGRRPGCVLQTASFTRYVWASELEPNCGDSTKVGPTSVSKV